MLGESGLSLRLFRQVFMPRQGDYLITAMYHGTCLGEALSNIIEKRIPSN